MDQLLGMIGMTSGFCAIILAIYDACVRAPIMHETRHGMMGDHTPVHVTEPSGEIRQYLFDHATGTAILESKIRSPFVFRMNPFRRKR